MGSRVGPWWRVWPDVAAHWLSAHRMLPFLVLAAACRWRGRHRFRYYEVAR